MDNLEPLKPVGDVISMAVIFAVFLDVLPYMTAILTVIWAGLRVYETILNIKVKRKELGK